MVSDVQIGRRRRGRRRDPAHRRRLPDEGDPDPRHDGRGVRGPRRQRGQGRLGRDERRAAPRPARAAARRAGEPEIPFAEPGSLTRVYAVASGKGGVGKSSVTVNLAAAMAAEGLRVGVVDADVYGFSVPRMLGVSTRPTQVDDMILPPIAHDVKVISIGMFVPGNQPVVWRGPMLHRALQQFLADVFWGDLDVLLLDLPPGTGDIAISVAQLIPERRDPGRHDAAAGRRRGRRAGRRHRAADPPADRRRRREHVLARAARRLPDGAVRLRRRPDRRRLADPRGRRAGAAAGPGAARRRRCARAGTAAYRSCCPTRTPRPRSSLRGVARQLSRRARGLAGRSLGLTPV